MGRAVQIIAMLTYFFRHTRSLTKRPRAVGGQSKNPLLCNVFAVPGAVSVRYVARLHAVEFPLNVQTQLCNSMEA
jgi:hypothetical protein